MTTEQNTARETALAVAAIARFVTATLQPNFDHDFAHRLLGKVYDVVSTADRGIARGETHAVITASVELDAANVSMFEAFRSQVRTAQGVVQQLEGTP